MLTSYFKQSDLDLIDYKEHPYSILINYCLQKTINVENEIRRLIKELEGIKQETVIEESNQENQSLVCDRHKQIGA